MNTLGIRESLETQGYRYEGNPSDSVSGEASLDEGRLCRSPKWPHSSTWKLPVCLFPFDSYRGEILLHLKPQCEG